ncbi:MAG: NYN domain-containing protein [Planctomycetes bacterium]|nr:NYN domain-containing protein [Planctomycetota bacterium]
MDAAVFVDFENLYLSLKDRCEASDLRTRELALQVLDGMLARLREKGKSMVLGRAYATFDSYPGIEVAHDLALMGLDPQYVIVSPTGKSSADIQLALDVARVVYRRPDIDQIVIVSGDRDFIPLARQVLEENRELTVVAIPDHTSGDLRARVGEDRFQDALELLPEREREMARGGDATPKDPESDEGAVGDSSTPRTLPDRELATPDSVDEPTIPRETGSIARVVGRIPVTWNRDAAGHEEAVTQCVELLLRARQRHGSTDIWLSPFLKGPMSQHFSHLVHPDRRALINELRSRGIIRVEERENQYAEYPYSVIVVEDEHPVVRAAAERVASKV